MGSKNSSESINENFKGKDIVSLDQLNTQSLYKLFALTKKVKKKIATSKPNKALQGKIVTLIFYEPSSRTFASFAAATKLLGGQTIEIQDPQHFSSVSKGETLEDTIRVFEAYSHAIVLRHPVVGTAQKAADAADFAPIINAGDGIGEHPTQAMLDLFTIYEKFGKLDNLTGVLAGDLLNGRTIHSLIRGLALFKKNKLFLLSPAKLKLTRDDFAKFSKRGVELIEIETENEMPKNAHFWYWTRVQKERFENIEEYEKVKNRFIVTGKLLKERGNRNLIVMHPLPRVGEILYEVDADPRAIYLTSQVRNGMYVRMALLALVLGREKYV